MKAHISDIFYISSSAKLALKCEFELRVKHENARRKYGESRRKEENARLGLRDTSNEQAMPHLFHQPSFKNASPQVRQ
jgi:hypothetical protein